MNQTIVKYTICTATTRGMMIDQINNLIQDDWQPFGELQIHDHCFYQTMVKYKRPVPHSVGPR